MKNFDTRTYNISDFLEWQSSDLLDLSPKFQRRSVWSLKAKSYLIDTIIRGKPIPKILLTQNLTSGRNIRTVVDGQQRIRAILEYVNGDFTLSRAHNKDYAGIKYENLDPDLKSEVLKYEIGVDMLFDISYEDILDIFARVNTYSIRLNSQELLNATYLGYFKQSAYSLGYRYVRYFMDSKIITEKDVTRMAEAELASDLMVVMVGGVEAKKAIPAYYKRYDDEEQEITVSEAEEKFDNVMSFIGEIYQASDLSGTNFRRIHLFYSLFCTIGHALFGVKGLTEDRPSISRSNIGAVRVILDEISSRYDDVTSGNTTAPDKSFSEFIDASRRATSDKTTRILRANFLCKKLLAGLK